MTHEVTPLELADELRGENPPVIVDVREPHEVATVCLAPGAWPDSDGPRATTFIHIPLGQLEARFGELSKDDNLVMICRSGGRSGKATDFLLSQGYTSVRNMVTGMNGWVAMVEPTLPIT